MDVLVEMTPGSGWLAREKQRLVFLPIAEPVEVAHDVIEPLLLPRELDESFATFQDWITTGRPLPPMLLLALESSVRMMSHNLPESAGLEIVESATGAAHQLSISTTPEPVQLGQITSVAAGDRAEEPSGMLVEGVVRAGGLQLHIHRGWSSADSEETVANVAGSQLEIEVDGHRIPIGRGVVIGRWPYSHPDFDQALEVVILSDPAVSRLHAEIRLVDGAASLYDRGSHNGTWVVHSAEGNTTRADAGAAVGLAPGDTVRIGDSTIRIH